MLTADLLCDKQVAAEFGLSLHTLRSARSNKSHLRTPPFVKQGGRIYYSREAVIQFCNEQSVSPFGPHTKYPEKR